MASSGDRNLSRRGFLKFALGSLFSVTLAGFAVPVLGYLLPPRGGAVAAAGPERVAGLEDIPAGKGRVVSFRGKPVILFNTRETGVRALSAVCTHLGCIVNWCEEHQYIHCPCHDGIFDVNGNVVSGPPPSPLPKYQLAVQGNDIYIEEGKG